MSPSKPLSTALLASVFAASWIAPIWPLEQALNSVATIIGFFFLWKAVQKNYLTDGEFFLIVIFLAAHTLAARWLYSNVPYEKWLQACCGFTLKQSFGWKRNHFDRLVHFLYGFCFTPAIVSYVMQKFKQNKKAGFYFAITAIMVTSLWYEWFEWVVALVLSEKDAESYNGQQGDAWDAHKDMLLATIGSGVWFWRYASSKTNRSSVPAPQPGGP